MSRPCPVCEHPSRTEVFRMSYKIPDGWKLPSEIIWNTCDRCNMIYGDGDFGQSNFYEYYKKYYGYGVNNPANTKRLQIDAASLGARIDFNKDAVIVDFGGAGDDGISVLVDSLHSLGYHNAISTGIGDTLPDNCNLIYASHVIEHIYNLPETMAQITGALAPDGVLIIDVPDATGLLLKWNMPIIDFNTKHLNHFTLRNLLDLGHRYGFELIQVRPYDLEFGPCYQAVFKRLDVARESREHIILNMGRRSYKLMEIKEPVNIWGLGDITWHVMSWSDLQVLDYIDNDPAFRGQTYNGKLVQERPGNDAPIVILSQGQRKRLIENIKKICSNRIIEI